MRKTIKAGAVQLLAIIILATALLSSCTIKQEIYIDVDSSGAAYFDIVVEEFFTEVVEDFTVFVPEDEADVTDLNMKEIEQTVNDSPYASQAVFYEIEENHYTGTFQFPDAGSFFNDVQDELQLETLFTYTKGTNSNTLSLHLDIENYAELTELIPILKDPSFSIFGPEENIGVSEADYLDMISYLLGEEGPDAIGRSYISMIINTDASIISTVNGKVLSDNEVEFMIPMIDFLLLAEPIDYAVTWRNER